MMSEIMLIALRTVRILWKYHLIFLVEMGADVEYCCVASVLHWSDIYLHYEMVAVVSRVIVCSHTKLLQYYWSVLKYILYPPWLVYFMTKVCTNSFHLFCQTLSASFPSGTTALLSISESLFSFCFVYLFWFLDSTYKWDDTVFVFVSDVSLSTIPFGSIHLSQMASYDSVITLLTTVRHHMLLISVIWQ